METIISGSLTQSVTYRKYRDIITKLLAAGKSTGSQQSDALTHYTLLNETRMNRIEKTVTISSENSKALKQLGNQYNWLVISEGWCGDAAQILPILDKMAEMADIDLRIVFRDEHDELMNLFLTNGSKSIPKLIILDKENRVLADWGPRPAGASELIKKRKAEMGFIDDAAKTELQMWYLHDKGMSTQDEIVSLMVALDRS